MAQFWLSVVLEFVVAMIAVVVISLATQLRAGAGFVGASLISLMQFGTLLAAIIRTWTQAEISIGAVTRLETFSKTIKNENADGAEKKPPENWPEHGVIEMRSISASYE
jgi:ATP-binding cassette subfamily C (CFTR/MRP) protein 1